MSNTEKGMGLGGLIGAGAGTAIGAATGNPRTGALVGGLLGAGVGGAVGADADREELREARDAAIAQAAATAQANPPLGMMDVVEMSQQGVDADVIINQIHNSGSTFNLSRTDIQYLTQCQVDPRVIRAMQMAQARPAVVAGPPRTVVVHEPPPVFIAPAPIYPIYMRPPPPAFGFHYHVIRRR
jgi:surface antigen